ncbi:MAG TPA: type IV toxin-antitoxin system AbiEi family antitoxin domain-containing protein [Actinomycetota bacterium]
MAVRAWPAKDEPTGDADLLCAAVARGQHGVLSRVQALERGLSPAAVDRRVAAGRWETIYPGVFRIAGAPSSWEQQLMAAVLHAGLGALVSHRAAAALWSLDGAQPGLVEIATPRRLRAEGVLAHQTRRSRLRAATVGAIPVTDVPRTLLDLGSVTRPAIVEQALDDALRRGLCTLDELRVRLKSDGGRGRRGAGVLRALLDERDPASAAHESLLETRLARLIADAYLPPPIPQYEVRDGARLIARVDFAWPDELVAVEADGYRFHSGAAAWRRDRARRNELTRRGWGVFHVTWHDVTKRPNALILELREALGLPPL